jgi:hypothetical protein
MEIEQRDEPIVVQCATGDDELSVQVNITDEGIIIDVYRGDGLFNFAGTVAMTFEEWADYVAGENGTKTSRWSMDEDIVIYGHAFRERVRLHRTDRGWYDIYNSHYVEDPMTLAVLRRIRSLNSRINFLNQRIDRLEAELSATN